MVIGDCSTESMACCGQLEVPVVVSLQESLAPLSVFSVFRDSRSLLGNQKSECWGL